MRQLSPVEQAYTSLLADSAYAVIVLRDLAGETGFMAALPAGSDPAILTDHNAARRVFGRIYEILSLTPQGRATLAAALSPAEPKESEP